MAKRSRARRDVNGILVLDKPIGLSSNAALQEAKRLFYAKKAGHTGSLDPLATGVLPLCFGEATKFSQFLLDANKRYQATVTLGVATSTGDYEGEVIEEKAVDRFNDQELEAALDQFRGEIGESPINFECKINDIIVLGERGGAGSLVLAEILKVHISKSSNLKIFKFEI